MIKIELTSVFGWEAAIRGMRNPLNSWASSDSCLQDCSSCVGIIKALCIARNAEECELIGKNDLGLMEKLCLSGSDHRKFMRFITVSADVTAPLYWWKEYDTYKVGTVANSCSTMHKISSKEFELDDFSHEHLSINSIEQLESLIAWINMCRDNYNYDKDKDDWWQMIQLLPSSYNQRRTIQLNYEVLRNIYHSREKHKLDEWRELCEWIKNLPYAKELICGGANNE